MSRVQCHGASAFRRYRNVAKKFYVGNFDFSATKSDVETAFSIYGELDKVQLITDRDTGRSHGFAFVTFATQQDAESALEMKGKTLDGRNLIDNIAKE